MEKENKYIFISHSHADLTKVRLVRNTFEDRGYEPILFYLHSLSDENEITDLIKREIDARLWFCLCDSQNARKSRWVQSELNYVKEQGKRTLATIDIDKIGALEVAEQKRIVNLTVDSFSRANSVFLSYAHSDAAAAEKIIEVLNGFGFHVWNYLNDILVGDFWMTSIENAIRDSKYYFILVSEQSMNSSYVSHEISRAITEGKTIIPIFIDESATKQNMMGNRELQALMNTRCVFWSFDNPIESVKALINVIPVGDY